MPYPPGSAPIIEALQQLAQTEVAALHMPGHKRRSGSLLENWLGRAALASDQTEVRPLDSLHAPDGPIAEAEALTARLYGVRATYFTTNGSSAGLIASLLACTQPGDQVLLPRNVHKSLVSGLVLGDLLPRFLPVPEHAGIQISVSESAVRQSLTPETQAVVLVHPTYEGVTLDLTPLTAACRAAGSTVIVDEAHGAHLHFHPSLPPSAVTSQADLVVQSAHKTLSALTGAAWIHRLSADMADEAVRSRLNLLLSTSPSWLLLGSLDLARLEMETAGFRLLGQAIARAQQLAADIEANTGFVVWQPPAAAGLRQDPLKICLLTGPMGYIGWKVADHLANKGIHVEMAKYNSILLMLTVGDAEADHTPLVKALQELPQQRPLPEPPAQPPIPPLILRPRQAYLAPTRWMAAREAQGKVAARPVYAYPPGIPLVHPGELITAELLEYAETIERIGGHLNGLQQQTWAIVDDR